MSLKKDVQGRYCVVCNDRHSLGCHASTYSVWTEEAAFKMATQIGWHHDLVTGMWSCPSCVRVMAKGTHRVRGFRTKDQLLAAMPLALSDLLFNRRLHTYNNLIVISKEGLSEFVLRNLRHRFGEWRFKVEEDQLEMRAAPIT